MGHFCITEPRCASVGQSKALVHYACRLSERIRAGEVRFFHIHSKGRCDLRLKIETYLKEIGYPGIVMVNVDVDVWRGFIDFLRYARNGMCKGRQCHQQRCGISSSGSAERCSGQSGTCDGVLSAHPLKSISSKEKYQ